MKSEELSVQLKKYRLSESEYELIKEQLGREPRGVEWALYSALWSEHCSYKSSRVHLKKLFNSSPRLVQGFGENAGVIDLGEGEKVAFKMESHNHPSFIEPYQGAATGVGGILRDIFTMGARPVALANYLCFGDPKADRMDSLVHGVVSGISGYGNCVGVPMVTGQTEYDSRYNQNILVNAFALGYFEPGAPVMTAKAKGVGNDVVYVGAKTGRDGVHGASMASESFGEESEAKRPTIQIGDPFYEKLLIESCLEVMKEGLVESIQDMGAAGLTSSSFEMSASGGVGLDLYLDRVPLRDETLAPEDILLSESQERMLLVCTPENFQRVQEVFEKWGLDAVRIGKVKDKREVTLHWHDEVLASLDPDLIVENSPCYQRDFEENYSSQYSVNDLVLPSDIDLAKNLSVLVSKEKGTKKNWIYDQYDQRVGAQTEFDCSETIGVIRLPFSGRPLGICLGGRPSVMKVDAKVGGIDSVALPSLKLALKGFEPLAVTDCLNYGNPEKREIMTEFVHSVRAMSDQCEALKAPIISGNVSLYNETQDQNIISTPATAIVGLREEKSRLTPSSFVSSGEGLYKISLPLLETNSSLDGLDFFENFQIKGDLDVHKVAGFSRFLLKLSQKDFVTSSRMVTKFGLAYTLFLMSEKNEIGLKILSQNKKSSEFLKETFYEAVLTVNDSVALERFFEEESNEDLLIERLGETTEDKELDFGIQKVSLISLKEKYEKGLEGVFDGF